MIERNPLLVSGFASPDFVTIKMTMSDFYYWICDNVYSKKYPKFKTKWDEQNNIIHFNFGDGIDRKLLLFSYKTERRGAHLRLLILDEFQKCPRRTYTKVFQGYLNDAGARVIAIGTPPEYKIEGKINGQNVYNAFYEMYKKGLDDNEPRYKSFTFKGSDSGLLSPQVVQEKRETMPEEDFMCEIECDFDAYTTFNSVFGDFYERFAKLKASKEVNWVPNHPVYTAWDIGRKDFTAIWFFQLIEGTPRFINYYENNGKVVDFYAEIASNMPYRYGYHFLPQDGGNNTVLGDSFANQLRRTFANKVVVMNNSLSHRLLIEKGRQVLQTALFNSDACALGIEYVRNAKYDVNRSDEPNERRIAHEYGNDGVFAFGYAAVAIDLLIRSGGIVNDYMGKIDVSTKNPLYYNKTKGSSYFNAFN
jgi:hypothetical protein